MLDRQLLERRVELRIDERDGRAGVLHDVADFVHVQPEVHRHDDAAEDADAEESHQEARGVR